MKRIVALIVFFAGLVMSARGQEAVKLPEFRGSLVIVRIIEQTGTLLKDGIFVSDGEGGIFELELPALRAKNQTETLNKTVQVLNELRKQGYKLISSNSGGASSAALLVTSYIFQRD